MKKIVLLSLLNICFVLTQPVFAEESDYNAIDKLGRGISNATLAIGEIPKQVMKETRESNLFYGMTSGFFVGLVRTVLRTAVGVFEIATFPVPYPNDYAPIMKPAHVFQSNIEEKETELEE
ncbi:MAG: exosortase system-associated protein, TIGR04073 family [Nitrospinae bacterium]|nr:exosortase system-associated protein, TIGR04073 family [Nitrospinota bacterium]